MTLVAGETGTSAISDSDQRLMGRIDEARLAMEAEMDQVRARCRTYLNWYSPPYSQQTLTHDAWVDKIRAEDIGLTRANFPIARAVVDIWTALEASTPPTIWAEPERVAPAAPSLDQDTELRGRLVTQAFKRVEAVKAGMRAQRLRAYSRRDKFPLQAYFAHRRKNLYGFSWTKVWPHPTEMRPQSYTLKNPTTVYPLWSDREPGEVEAVLVAYQINVNRANALYGLGIPTQRGQIHLGHDSGVYRTLDDKWYDSSRTMLWVEEFWWREQEFDGRGARTSSTVCYVTRVAGQIVRRGTFEGWGKLPWIYLENTDERDAYGWSDIASVIDINDEFNRRLSQEGDIIGSFSAPRYQLLNAFAGRSVEMPGPFELISLQDQERIEQILTRIDLFPTQQHFNILTDLLHRCSGLPPITWGLIQNAQTSGRALSASWKATEARLAPKLIRDEKWYDDWLELALQYAEVYDWRGARELYAGSHGERYRDFRWEFPPMEPRDFMEVTQNEVTKRDAGLTTTLKAIRAMGDEAAEDTFEEVLAEWLNIFLHPDKAQAFLLAQRAELDNLQFASELGVQLGGPNGGTGEVNPASVAAAVGEARQAQRTAAAPPAVASPGTLPPTAPGAAANTGAPPIAAGSPGEPPGGSLTSGTLVRGGRVSNQMLSQRRFG